MKFTVNGFSQRILLDLGLDLVDASVLRWFIDFQGTGRMEEKHDNQGRRFFWVRYQALMSDLPILGLSTTDSVMRRFKKLASCGVLEHFHNKVKGSFSTYRIGPKYLVLIDDSVVTENAYPSGSKVGPPPDQKSDPIRIKSRTKDPSTNRPFSISSSFDYSNPDGIEPGDLAVAILAYLNQVTGASFRTSERTGLTSLLEAGHGFEDFRLVIDSKVAEWSGSDWAKYLRPSTLFRPAKFDEYLNTAKMLASKASHDPERDRTKDPLAGQFRSAV